MVRKTDNKKKVARKYSFRFSIQLHHPIEHNTLVK